MSLQVWIPFTDGTLKQQGVNNSTVSSGGTISLTGDGKLGKCVTFTSTAGGLTIPPSTMTSFTTECSVSFWLKINGWGSSYDTYFQAGTGSTPWTAYIFGFLRNGSGSTICFTIGNTSSASNNSYITSTMSTGVWYHVALTYETGKVKIYLNGSLDKEYTTSIVPAFNKITKISVGRSNSDSNYQTQCSMNDLRIYDNCLSAQEVKEISKGLVLHYQLSDRYIENTTNLITTEDCLSATCYNGATSKYGYGENTNMYKTVGTFQGRKCTKVYNQTSGTGMYPYVYISNMYTSNGTNAPEYKTLSFDYYTTVSTSITPYKLGSGSGTATYTVTNTEVKTGTGTNSVTIPVKQNMWNHVEVTFHGTTDADAQWGYIQNNPSHTANTSNYWLFANMQLESKNHATGYAGVNSTRTSTTAKDTSGFGYNGTLTGIFIIDSNTPKYNVSTVFSSNAIKKGDFSIGNVWSAGIWFYPLSTISSGWDMLFGLNSSGGDADIKLGIWYNNTDRRMEFEANGQYDSTSVVIPSKDAWYYAVETFDGTTLSMYLNGELKKTKSITNAELIKNNLVVGGRSSSANLSSVTSYFRGKLSDFRIYATALSANDVLSLYNNGAYIDSAGNIHGKIR